MRSRAEGEATHQYGVVTPGEAWRGQRWRPQRAICSVELLASRSHGAGGDVAGLDRRRRAAPHLARPERRRRLGARRRPRPLAVARRRSPTPTVPCCTASAFDARATGPRGSRTGWSSTASSTKATSGSTAPTSVTPRATSSPTPSRSPTPLRSRTEHVLGIEVDLCPARRPHREAQHHRRVPALGLPRPRLEPRRHLATGAGRARPARCASAACACCAARPTAAAGRAWRSAPSSTADAAAHRGHGAHGGRRRRPRIDEQPLAAGREPRRVDGDRSERPALWWPHALGDQPLHDVAWSTSTQPTATLSHRADLSHRAASGVACGAGSARSTASGCS